MNVQGSSQCNVNKGRTIFSTDIWSCFCSPCETSVAESIIVSGAETITPNNGGCLFFHSASSVGKTLKKLMDHRSHNRKTGMFLKETTMQH